MQKIIRTRKKRGFTLIEMIVVIAIIGILSTLILISVSSVRKNSIDTRRKSNLENVRGAINTYYSVKGTWPTFTNWTNLNSTLSDAGYLVDTVAPDEDSDGEQDYSALLSTHPWVTGHPSCPCQMGLCVRCKVSKCEGYWKTYNGSDWYCLFVK